MYSFSKFGSVTIITVQFQNTYALEKVSLCPCIVRPHFYPSTSGIYYCLLLHHFLESSYKGNYIIHVIYSWLLSFNMRFLRFIHVIYISGSFLVSPFFKKKLFMLKSLALQGVVKIVQRSHASHTVSPSGYILHKKISIFLQSIL